MYARLLFGNSFFSSAEEFVAFEISSHSSETGSGIVRQAGLPCIVMTSIPSPIYRSSSIFSASCAANVPEKALAHRRSGIEFSNDNPLVPVVTASTCLHSLLSRLLRTRSWVACDLLHASRSIKIVSFGSENTKYSSALRTTLFTMLFRLQTLLYCFNIVGLCLQRNSNRS